MNYPRCLGKRKEINVKLNKEDSPGKSNKRSGEVVQAERPVSFLFGLPSFSALIQRKPNKSCSLEISVRETRFSQPLISNNIHHALPAAESRCMQHSPLRATVYFIWRQLCGEQENENYLVSVFPMNKSDDMLFHFRFFFRYECNEKGRKLGAPKASRREFSARGRSRARRLQGQ